MVLEERIFLTAAYIPALVPSGCSPAKSSPHVPFAVTLAEDGLVEVVVGRCSEGG